MQDDWNETRVYRRRLRQLQWFIIAYHVPDESVRKIESLPISSSDFRSAILSMLFLIWFFNRFINELESLDPREFDNVFDVNAAPHCQLHICSRFRTHKFA